jgi:hypothetical protein
MKPSLLLSLGAHSKDAGDEHHLPEDVSFLHATHLPFPDHMHHLVSAASVRHAVSNEKKPIPGLMRRLMKR